MQKIRESAKAIAALAAPVLASLVIDVAAELSNLATAGIAAAATAVVVWLTPNAERIDA